MRKNFSRKLLGIVGTNWHSEGGGNCSNSKPGLLSERIKCHYTMFKYQIVLNWNQYLLRSNYFFFLLPCTAIPCTVTPPEASWTFSHFSGSKGSLGCLLSWWICIVFKSGTCWLQIGHLNVRGKDRAGPKSELRSDIIVTSCQGNANLNRENGHYSNYLSVLLTCTLHVLLFHPCGLEGLLCHRLDW